MTEVATRVRVATALVMLATFLVGGAVGAGIQRVYFRGHHGPPPMLPLAELNLTPEQDKAARDIIERRRPELEAIMGEMRPKIHAIHDDVERDVRKLLNPEQQKKLDELKARRPPRGPDQRGFFAPPQGARDPLAVPPPGAPGVPPPPVPAPANP